MAGQSMGRSEVCGMQMESGAGAQDGTSPPIRPAPWSRRAVAFVLDAAIAGLAGGLVALALTQPDVSHASATGTGIRWGAGGPFVFDAVLYLVLTAYFTFCSGSRRGQTLGSLAMGLAVRHGSDGGQLGAARGLVRSLLLCAFVVPYLLIPWVFDCLWPLWDPARRALHDRVAGSVVVDLR
jgi:uncharacterized RDD family membrane protein YckC